MSLIDATTPVVSVQLSPTTFVSQIAPTVPIGSQVDVPGGTLLQPGTALYGGQLISSSQLADIGAARKAADDAAIAAIPAGAPTLSLGQIVGSTIILNFPLGLGSEGYVSRSQSDATGIPVGKYYLVR